MSGLLAQLATALKDGTVKVIDLTQPLGPETPVIGLPPIFASSPGVTIEQISRYDAQGPGWYWNTLHLGEHTGTHFDAPVHWITGSELDDNRCDTILPSRLVAPACVIDVSADVAENPDFLLMPERIEEWEAQHGRIPAGSWVLLRTDWSKRSDPQAFLNVAEDGAHSPGFHKYASHFLAHDRDVLGVGVETVGTDGVEALRKKLAEIPNEMGQVTAAFGRGDITLEEYDREVKNLTASHKQLIAVLDDLEKKSGKANSKLVGLGQAGMQTGRIIQDFAQGGLGIRSRRRR